MTCKQIARFSCVLKLWLAVPELKASKGVAKNSRIVQDVHNTGRLTQLSKQNIFV